MDIIEQRTGVYEIQDKYISDDRSRTLLLLNLSLLASGLFVIAGIGPLFVEMNNVLKYIIVILFFVLAGIASYSNFMFRKKLVEEINGFVLRFDDGKNVIDFLVRHFQKGKTLDIIERSVRFNQAIGFQALLDDDGDITVSIIVDPDFPGAPIFRTYDIFALAELILLFQLALPNLKTWIYRTNTGENWADDFREELNNEIQVAKVPWVIREFFI